MNEAAKAHARELVENLRLKTGGSARAEDVAKMAAWYRLVADELAVLASGGKLPACGKPSCELCPR